MKKRHFSHCRYCIPIHQAALLSHADHGVSWAFLFIISWLQVCGKLCEFWGAMCAENDTL